MDYKFLLFMALIVSAKCSSMKKRSLEESQTNNDQPKAGIFDGLSTTTTQKPGLIGGLPDTGSGNKMIMGTFQGIISNVGLPLPGGNPFGGVGKK